MRQLFPAIEPFNTGYLNKGLHEIYYEQSGNPDGYPVLFLHGGPGEEATLMREDSSIQAIIRLLFLTKEGQDAVSHLAV